MVWAEHVSHVGNLEGLATTLGWPLDHLLQLAAELQSNPQVLDEDRSDDEASLESGGARRIHYHQRIISIRGKARSIDIPLGDVLAVQKQIRELLQYPCEELLDGSCHGYRPGRSTLTNAQPHVGHRRLQKLDVERFFPSTRFEMVAQMFRGLGFDEPSSLLLSGLCTVHDGLPLGSPTSPAISNLMLSDFDREMADEARRLGLAYTRYADDITLSSNSDFDLTSEVRLRLQRFGYTLAESKTLLQKRGQPAKVTGLVVWDGEKPRLPQKFRSRLATELHYIERYGFDQHAFREYDWSWIDADLNPEKHLHTTAEHLRGRILYALSIQRDWTIVELNKHPKARHFLFGSQRSREKRQAERVAYMRKLAQDIRRRVEPRAPRWEA